MDWTSSTGFVACDGGHIVIVDLVDGKEVAVVPISGQPDAIWFNPRRRRLYVGIASPGLLEVVDTARALVVESIPTEAGGMMTVVSYVE